MCSKQPPKIKKRTCKAKGCTTKFMPINTFHVACCPKCAIAILNAKKKKKATEARKETKKQLEDARPYSYWVKKAQAACNKYIRIRDKNEPCISCGTTNPNIQYCAGHYLTVGSSPGLRFHPMNIHKQCNRNCNMGLSGNITNYRINLIEKIGLENVEWLENNRNGYTPTVEEVKEVEAHYKELAKGASHG